MAKLGWEPDSYRMVPLLVVVTLSTRTTSNDYDIWHESSVSKGKPACCGGARGLAFRGPLSAVK